ncbi:3'-5' exonuclease [Bacillus atrophaeus]|uniref:3'-5' exonuclease n=1 Tax=Bacillus atrophaeus TaxID=1452 RepID=UPI00227F5D32|nr:nuclease-related domain-containing DEAD/DEAH box helicase [Bacillus atrophaeus]MCY8932111.1 NERD domain-containing protein [Bacillus atrophaeus]MCY8943024.1 NERD domain-containing protein [Bacillus atrophaeus]MCY8946878.1 NERD domain-containing protein [Bacillus atrophaeus]
MATTIPESIKSTATAGERILFRTLRDFLPHDYIVYYEPEIHGVRPDFVIIGPDIGLLVLEVKDYTKNTFYNFTRDNWTIRSVSGDLHSVKNPFKQAKDYTFKIVELLKKDKNLIQTEGKYQFKLKFPYGYGVVFTRLNEVQLLESKVYEMIDPEFILSRDQIDPDHELFSEDVLMEKLLQMFHIRFRLEEPLTSEEINTIRYYLFPEIRLGAELEKTTPYRDQLLLSLRDIKTMDLHQENMAKQIGDKHRLIRGVAGSGKTLILASRAKMLAKDHPDWKILILCFNISLSRNIAQMVRSMYAEPENVSDTYSQEPLQVEVPENVHIRNFHEWVKQDLHINIFKIDQYIEELEKGERISPKYDAVLIDEGQDFEGNWLKLIRLCLNPDTQSLLLVEDRAQSIYGNKRSYVKETGLDFRGRSKILNINYRNTAQIISLAWDFYEKYATPQKKSQQEGEGVEIISPKSTKRKGPEAAILKFDSIEEEMRVVAKQIVNFHEEKKIPYSEIAILYRANVQNMVNRIKKVLEEWNIPFNWIAENNATKRNFNPEEQTVKIITIDSSKGLDFQSVFLVKADLLPFPKEKDKERDVSLMYIGMTRSKEYLCITYSGESDYTAYFNEMRKREANSMLLNK